MLATLIRKEWKLEWRQRHALTGLVLFVLASCYTCYLALGSLEAPEIWSALLWINGVFAAFNAMQKTFQAEANGALLYLYTLAPARLVILARILYNSAMVVTLNLLSVVFLWLFFGTAAWEQLNAGLFAAGLVLGGCALGSALTFTAALAFRAGGGSGLVAVLGFPVAMPVLMAAVRTTGAALSGSGWAESGLGLVVLATVLASVLVLSLVLFPYLWRD